MRILCICLVAYMATFLPDITESQELRLRFVHYERFEVTPEPEPFLEVSHEQVEAWEHLIDQCTPIDTRKSLSETCISLAEEYFSKEPVWVYAEMYYYHSRDGWIRLNVRDLGQRENYSFADFVNTDVPMWGDIFDGRIAQREERFYEVINDELCSKLIDKDTQGLHVSKAEHCAARELYKYATYLKACSTSQQRLTRLHATYSTSTPFIGLNVFEASMLSLDEWVRNETLRNSAKTRLIKAYLHARWISEMCDQQGFKTVPDFSKGYFLNDPENRPWSQEIDNYFKKIGSSHDQALMIAAVTGDDWAIRSYPLGINSSSFNQDLMTKYPLLMHRTLGREGLGFGFTEQEHAHHRAKAYLLLIEQVGEERARLEYDPSMLKDEIRYIENGGSLRLPPTMAEERHRFEQKWKKREEERIWKEMEGELL